MARVPMTLGAGVHLERTCKPCLPHPPGQATGSSGEGLHGCFPENPARRENREGVEGRTDLRGCVESPGQSDSSGKTFQLTLGPVGPAPGRQRLPTCRPVWVLVLPSAPWPRAPAVHHTHIPPVLLERRATYRLGKRGDSQTPGGAAIWPSVSPLYRLALVIPDWGCPRRCCRVTLGLKGRERGALASSCQEAHVL